MALSLQSQRRIYSVTVVCLCLAAALLNGPALRADTHFTSGPKKVALLELYTSQGCSSCPAADRWLSGLKERANLWDQFVPLALHVDYWDYIGWHDPFAQPAFGLRQRRYEDQGSINAIYTPGMMLDGQEWRGWARGENPESVNSDAGRLTLEVGEKIRVMYAPPSSAPTDLEAHIAILGFDLKSEVTRGENRGRELTNDFIVLQLVQSPLTSAEGVFTTSIPRFTTGPVRSRLAIAAWVESAGTQFPIQAVGGWYE